MAQVGIQERGAHATVASGVQPTFLLDDSQQAVLDLPIDACAIVTGAPGSGKTATAIELIADRVARHGLAPDEVLMLAPSRAAATRLRGDIATRIERATNGPLARTLTSVAFEIVRYAAHSADSEPPVLLTGGEQDQLVREMLEGHRFDGTGPAWPEHLNPTVRALRGFRSELRELLMRATEYGVTPQRLERLGVELELPEWIAAAQFATEYYDVVAAAKSAAVDSAELLAFAAAAAERGELPPRIAGVRLLVVDDLQEATESGLRLIHALQHAGCTVVAFADPDVASGAFRGASGGSVAALRARLPQPIERSLEVAHRHGPVLRDLVSRITARIGTAAVTPDRRRARPGRDDDLDEAVVVVHEPSGARELAAIARRLREHHLLHDVPLARMAVVVRSGAQVPGYARGLALAEVSTRTTAAAEALRDATAARALLTLVDVAIGRADLTADAASELLLGPFGGFDRLGLRRLRLALRAEEIAGGGNRQADELLVEALAEPGRLVTIDDRVGRSAARLARVLASVRQQHEAGATVEELIWLVWERCGFAEAWRAEALGSGVTAAEASRRLDAVLAVFTAARRFVERRPGHAVEEFLAGVLDAEVPEDTLAPQQSADSVLVTTPAGVLGAEFDVVVIAGLHEGVWPNLKVRGTLLQPDRLAAALETGGGADGGANTSTVPADARRQVLHDELRLLALATSRARRQVVLTAVVNDDSAASVFFSLLPELGIVRSPGRDGSTPLSLRGMTGALRRTLTAPRSSSMQRQAAAAALARLAAEGVPGAAPEQWQGLLPISTDAPLFDGDEHVAVSPSRIDAIRESSLDWFIDTIAGSEPGLAMAVGTIVHWAMENVGDAVEPEALWQLVEARIDELSFEAPWVADTERARMRTLITGLSEYLADGIRDGVRVVGQETGFQLDLGRARLRGNVDRVELHADGRVEIADLKTGRPITNQQQIQVHSQLQAYQLAYREGHFDALIGTAEHQSGGAKLVFVRQGLRGKAYQERVQTPLDDDAIAQFRELVADVLELMTSNSFSGPVTVARRGRAVPFRSQLHRVDAVTSDRATVDGADDASEQPPVTGADVDSAMLGLADPVLDPATPDEFDPRYGADAHPAHSGDDDRSIA